MILDKGFGTCTFLNEILIKVFDFENTTQLDGTAAPVELNTVNNWKYPVIVDSYS